MSDDTDDTDDGTGDDARDRAGRRRGVARLQDNPAGKVGFRDGRTVWEWNTGSGEFDMEQTTMLVRRLENPDLALQDSGAHENLRVRGRVAGPGPARRGGQSAPAPTEPDELLPQAFTPYGPDASSPPATKRSEPKGRTKERPPPDGLSLEATWHGPRPDGAFMPYGDDPPPADRPGRRRRR